MQTNNNLLPIDFGTVSTTGVLQAGTPNVTVSYNAVTTRYEITITGESYDITEYQTLVTPISNAARSAATDSVANKLLVKIFNNAGTAVADNFSFVVYKP